MTSRLFAHESVSPPSTAAHLDTAHADIRTDTHVREHTTHPPINTCHFTPAHQHPPIQTCAFAPAQALTWEDFMAKIIEGFMALTGARKGRQRDTREKRRPTETDQDEMCGVGGKVGRSGGVQTWDNSRPPHIRNKPQHSSKPVNDRERPQHSSN